MNRIYYTSSSESNQPTWKSLSLHYPIDHFLVLFFSGRFFAKPVKCQRFTLELSSKAKRLRQSQSIMCRPMWRRWCKSSAPIVDMWSTSFRTSQTLGQHISQSPITRLNLKKYILSSKKLAVKFTAYKRGLLNLFFFYYFKSIKTA